jgi:hypothetical protein
MSDEPATIREAIESNAKGPRSATTDGVQVTQHSIQDQIAADRHLAESTGAAKAHRGLRFTRLTPPGSSS